MDLVPEAAKAVGTGTPRAIVWHFELAEQFEPGRAAHQVRLSGLAGEPVIGPPVGADGSIAVDAGGVAVIRRPAGR